jgi:hypothetical protein
MLKKLLRPAKKLLYRAWAKFGCGPPARADNPYATHLPVLIGIAQLFKVERVLEFGCGLHSTLTFLDRSIFSDLEVLHSFDNNLSWVNKITIMTSNDTRPKIEFVDGPVNSVVKDINFQNYDLIFIDDSMTAEERVTTIRAVTRNISPLNMVVIHDFEVDIYRDSVKTFEYQFPFTALNPNTGIAWNQTPIDVNCLKKLNKIISRHSRHIQPDNQADWLRIINRSI